MLRGPLLYELDQRWLLARMVYWGIQWARHFSCHSNKQRHKFGHWCVHSKHSRVRFDPERVPWCQTHFWARPNQKTRSDWPRIRVRKTFLTQISCQFDPDSGSVWPRNGSGQMGPFPGQIWPGSVQWHVLHTVFVNYSLFIYYYLLFFKKYKYIYSWIMYETSCTANELFNRPIGFW